ncbi:MAG: PD-(D/E)XK nuclease family protein [Acidobacteriota bacterium]
MTGNAERRPTPSNLYSFSRLKTYHQCPLRYRYRYLQGLKEAFRSIESFLGNAVHEVLEWLYAERDRSESPGRAAMLEKFAAGWSAKWDDEVAVVRLADEEGTYLRLGREMLVRFHGETFVRDLSTTIALEQRLSTRLSPEVVFTGFADRVGRTEGGRLFVVDYKTSRSEGNDSEFSEGLQAPLYAACILEDHQADEALAGYHYLRHGTTRWRTVDNEQGRALLARFLQLIGEADSAAEYPAKPGILCAWCGFNSICTEAEVPEGLSGGLRIAEKRARRLFG